MKQEVPSKHVDHEAVAGGVSPEVGGERSPDSGSNASELSDESVGSDAAQEEVPSFGQAKLKPGSAWGTRFVRIKSE